MENIAREVSSKGQPQILVVPCTDSISSGQEPGSREGEQPELSRAGQTSSREPRNPIIMGKSASALNSSDRGEPSGFRGLAVITTSPMVGLLWAEGVDWARELGLG